MIYQICVVRDLAIGAFGVPFFVQSVGQAKRSFGDEVNKPDSPIHQHPEDYELFHLGSYDDGSTHFDLAAVPMPLGSARSYLIDSK